MFPCCFATGAHVKPEVVVAAECQVEKEEEYVVPKNQVFFDGRTLDFIDCSESIRDLCGTPQEDSRVDGWMPIMYRLNFQQIYNKMLHQALDDTTGATHTAEVGMLTLKVPATTMEYTIIESSCSMSLWRNLAEPASDAAPDPDGAQDDTIFGWLDLDTLNVVGRGTLQPSRAPTTPAAAPAAGPAAGPAAAAAAGAAIPASPKRDAVRDGWAAGPAAAAAADAAIPAFPKRDTVRDGWAVGPAAAAAADAAIPAFPKRDTVRDGWAVGPAAAAAADAA
eukprot:CAMPEP_0179256766 /NCGR_PEP_ID=MMETSP0797-20121207/24437_1 /TAXON_ID=47934 /ORGANISM="Dinophysis acuminata, Strain DAEP01" /LENGTH=278 /DNA_ID=CAMNT_0020964713 /DNA_START=58 /DNA_END=891 /DNA_ORIENTATION=+